MTTLGSILSSVAVVSAIPLLVVAVLPRDREKLPVVVSYLVSFAIGALLGSALLHLLPEAHERLGAGPTAGFATLAGFLGFFVLERFLWHHGHGAPQRTARRLPPLAALNVVGDAAHNFMDGMAIAASYLVAPSLGLTTTLAVVLHEVPQELGDYGILLHSGLNVRRAVLYNMASAAAAFVGALFVVGAGARFGLERFTDLLIPFTAGSFLYIAASDLLPELQRGGTFSTTMRQLAVIVSGVVVMLLPNLVGRT